VGNLLKGTKKRKKERKKEKKREDTIKMDLMEMETGWN
jgi:hypothetical protein